MDWFCSGPAPPASLARDASSQSGTAIVDCVDDGTFFGANLRKSDVLAAAYRLELKEFEAAHARIGGKDIGMRIEQQNWLERVANDCTDMRCLIEAFDARIADLRARYRNGG